MIIKPTDKTMKVLLEGAFYKIPRFQRPYSWDKENVDDFWTDAIANQSAFYFIGSFVLYPDKASDDVLLIVDGQQRLTTATILLAVLRNAFDSIEETALAKGVQSLIERSDVNLERRYVLMTETSYPYLQEYIQKHGVPALARKSGTEEEALEVAFQYLTAKVGSELDLIESRPGPAKQKQGAKKKKLLALRDHLLRLQLLTVELQGEDDAYIIFETLNTRGKDLGIADLVKNLVTRLNKPTNKGVDIAREKWQSILMRFNESAANIDVNSFVYHSWLSRSAYTGKERLFKDIKSSVTKGDVGVYLDNLVLDSVLYRQILEPGSGSWTKQEANLFDSLRALALFRVGQPLPMILAILRLYRSKKLSLSKTKAVLRSMEHFHVQFTALTAQRTGGGTAKMYAAAAEALTRATDMQKRADELAAFIKKLASRVPSYSEFEAGMEGLEYTSSNTKQKALVQYILVRLDQHQRSGAPVDYSKMTIEHIAPENPLGGAVPISRVGRLGNLLLLDEATNGKVANKPFASKCPLYSSSGLPLDATLAKASVWTDVEIEARTKAVSKLAYEKIFRV